jgi:hypothetical protein
MPDGGNWAGIWFSNWGELSLSVSGSAVVGEFCDENSNRYGRLEGTISGNVLNAHWITRDVSMGVRSRDSEGSLIAQFRLVPQGENMASQFDGTWGYNTKNADGGVFRAHRSGRRSMSFLRGNYSIPCPLREQNETAAPLSEDEVGDNPEPVEEDLSDGEEGAVEDNAAAAEEEF